MPVGKAGSGTRKPISTGCGAAVTKPKTPSGKSVSTGCGAGTSNKTTGWKPKPAPKPASPAKPGKPISTGCGSSPARPAPAKPAPAPAKPIRSGC